MLRFLKDRWILILALLIAASFGVNRAAWADDAPRYGDPEPLPSAGGDPDVPDGHTNATAYNGTSPQKRWALEGHGVGDVHAYRTDGFWRLIMILKGLRAYWFRF